MSADDHVHPGSAYMHTDELTDPEIRHVDGSLNAHVLCDHLQAISRWQERFTYRMAVW